MLGSCSMPFWQLLSLNHNLPSSPFKPKILVLHAYGVEETGLTMETVVAAVPFVCYLKGSVLRFSIPIFFFSHDHSLLKLGKHTSSK